MATCSADTTVKIWSISPNYDFKLEKVLQGHQRWVWDCAFSADSAYLVTGTSFILSNICSGVTEGLSIVGSYRTPLGDGFRGDCATVQWAS